MTFINALQIILEKEKIDEKIEEKIISLEEYFLQKNIELEFLENEILLLNKNFIDDEKISFANYLEEWKKMKNFLLENNLANLANYKNYFKIKKIAFSENNEEIDLNQFIAEVPKDDKKLLAVDSFLKNIKK